MATFPIELVTPEKLLYSGEVEALRAPGVDGSFGVLAGHAPMLAELGTGLIKLTMNGDRDSFAAVSGGFLQVNREKVIVLADAAELSGDIDVERAQAAVERGRKLLEVPGSDINAGEVQAAIERALNRIHVAQMHR